MQGPFPRLFAGVVALLVTCCGVQAAETWLPAIFGSHMVLQRDEPIPVWGKDEPGTEVVVSFGDASAKAVADATGAWRVDLPAQKASNEGVALTVTGTKTLTYDDVVVGEVWIGSGQSNMAWRLSQCYTMGKDETPIKAMVDSGETPNVRYYRVVNQIAPDGPRDDFNGRWETYSAGAVGGWGAVGYIFARKLANELGVTVAVINSSWGGTRVEAWTRPTVLTQIDATAADIKRYEKSTAEFNEDEARTKNAELKAKWEADVAAAKADGKPAPRSPRYLTSPGKSPQYPSTLYNGMIAPMVPFAMRGVIWYQGESNAGNAKLYSETFPGMISDWRSVWNKPEMPFAYVELANYQGANAEPTDGGWSAIREAQAAALALKNTGMACAIDVGQANDIHPRDKFSVGERLALWALATQYGKADLVYQGPTYASSKIEGNAVTISFTKGSIGDGLMVGTKPYFQAVVEDKGAALQRFQIAGADKQWVWADAKIVGDTVVVSSDKVAEPAAVRYAWSSNPAGANLYNRSGLPAPPFRTDSW